MPRLTEAERNQAIGMIMAGTGLRAVARQLNCSPATIFKLNRKWRNEGYVADLPRTGRPPVLTQNQRA